jgi:hypothetical protein
MSLILGIMTFINAFTAQKFSITRKPKRVSIIPLSNQVPTCSDCRGLEILNPLLDCQLDSVEGRVVVRQRHRGQRRVVTVRKHQCENFNRWDASVGYNCNRNTRKPVMSFESIYVMLVYQGSTVLDRQLGLY